MNAKLFLTVICAGILMGAGLGQAQTEVTFSHGFTTFDDGGIAYLRNSGNIAIIDEDDGFTRLDIYTTDGAFVNFVLLQGAGINDDGLADLPNGNLVVMTFGGQVMEIDPVSGAVVPGGYGGFNVLPALGPGAQADAFAVNPESLDLWVINDNGIPFDTLTQFDQNGTVIGGPIVALPANPNGDAEAVSFLPGLETLMVAEDDTNSLMEITPTGGLLQNLSVAALSAGSGLFVDPDGIAVDFDNNRMFVSNKGDNFGNVMVFNLGIDDQILLGDVNCDGAVNLLDIVPFINVVNSGLYEIKADMNQDGVVDLVDVAPFVAALNGN